MRKTGWTGVTNVSGFDAPPFALLKPFGPVDEFGCLPVTRPDEDSEQGLFVNGPVTLSDGQRGAGTLDAEVILAYSGADPDQGDDVGSAAGSWLAASGKTGFKAITDGADGVTNAVRVAPSAAGGLTTLFQRGIGTSSKRMDSPTVYGGDVPAYVGNGIDTGITGLAYTDVSAGGHLVFGSALAFSSGAGAFYAAVGFTYSHPDGTGASASNELYWPVFAKGNNIVIPVTCFGHMNAPYEPTRIKLRWYYVDPTGAPITTVDNGWVAAVKITQYLEPYP